MTQNQILINSYTMKQSGNDCSFVCDLKFDYKIKKRITLNQAVFDTQFSTFYRSQGGVDFTQFNVTYAGVDHSFTCYQYLTYTTFVTWFNTQLATINPNLLMVMNPVSNGDGAVIDITQHGIYTGPEGNNTVYPLTFSFNICLLALGAYTAQAITLWGDGWRKLGFSQYVPDDVTGRPEISPQGGINIFTGLGSMDFSTSPVMIISLSGMSPSINTQFGSHQFVVPITGTYGGKTYYTNSIKETC